MLLFDGNETSCMNHINSICTIFYFYVFILFHYDLKIVMQIYGVWKTLKLFYAICISSTNIPHLNDKK